MLALPIVTLPAGQAGGHHISIAIISEQIAVKLIGPGACHNVGDPSINNLVRRWSQQSAKPELLDCARRNVLRDRANSLVGNVESVHIDPGCAAVTTVKRERRKTILSRIDRATVLELHPGRELCDRKDVAVVDRQTAIILGR